MEQEKDAFNFGITYVYVQSEWYDFLTQDETKKKEFFWSFITTKGLSTSKEKEKSS